MLWTDSLLIEIKTAFADRIAAGDTLVVHDEKTMSGKPHIGSLRSGSMHAFLVDAMKEAGIAVQYLYEINDTDAFDTVPTYVPTHFAEHIGKRLCDIPSPSGTHENFAEEMADGYCRVMTDNNFPVAFYRQSANYNAGKYDELIRIAIEKKDLIRTIYKEVSGSEKSENWLPVQVICENCGKIATTDCSDWDGQTVAYRCVSRNEFTGCGHEGRISPLGGRGTLPWKVEWAAKWSVTGTDIEGAGKDHYTAGGSRQASNRIAEEVFGRAHPYDIRHEFILIGGSKMSSSKGVGATAEAVSAMLPRHIFRFMLVMKDPMKTINFSPDGDTIPLLFDGYDAAARAYADPEKRKVQPNEARAYEIVHAGTTPPPPVALPKFSQIVFLAQMPHLDLEKECEAIKGSPLSAEEKTELATRVDYAKRWLVELAPEQYRFKLGDYAAETALDDAAKKIIAAVVDFLEQNPDASGHDIHAHLHELKTQFGLEPKEIFQPFYRLLFGRDNGPQLGFMLRSLPRDETVQVLKKVF